MSDWLYYTILSLIQGLTEFLPISSSAHLALFPLLSNHADQGIAFDVAIHLGTIVAVMYYFRYKIKWMWYGFWRSVGRNPTTKPMGYYSKLAWFLILASIPVAIAGATLHNHIESIARSPIVIGYASIIFGILLWVADAFSSKQPTLAKPTLKSTFVIGLFQVLAIIPGTSRSGITLTGGLFMGMSRKNAATFSFLLAIPTILMAGGYESLKLLGSTNTVAWPYFLLGFSISSLTAFWCIHFFLKLINTVGILPFVIYRILLGLGLLIVFH
tara:strand:+ start:74240 stop:75052 length:813 start_codon:yes stop_codon:yes gene_type:complete